MGLGRSMNHYCPRSSPAFTSRVRQFGQVSDAETLIWPVGALPFSIPKYHFDGHFGHFSGSPNCRCFIEVAVAT